MDNLISIPNIFPTKAESVLLFEEVINDWLRKNYTKHTFYAERDLVWTIQTQMNAIIKARNLPYTVYNDYPIIKKSRRSLCVDLAILNVNKKVEVAIEFKYEPAHHRPDMLAEKYPVVSWGNNSVAKDISRIQDFVTPGKGNLVDVAYSIFIDEGSWFRRRKPHPGSSWVDWDDVVVKDRNLSILWAFSVNNQLVPS